MSRLFAEGIAVWLAISSWALLSSSIAFWLAAMNLDSLAAIVFLL